MVITWEEALAARKVEGKSEGLRVAVTTLLRRRFGMGSKDLEARLQNIADPAKLEELLEQAIDGRSPEELGLAS